MKRKLALLTIVTVFVLGACVTQAFAAVTFLENPDAAYLGRTTKADFAALADGSEVTQVMTADMLISLDATMTKGTVPSGGWATWAAPPYAESATPSVLKSVGSKVVFRLNKPVKEFGLEVEPNSFAVEPVTTVFKVISNDTTLALIPRSVDGSSGSRLFSIRSDVPFDRIEVSDAAAGTAKFAVAQLRYAIGTRSVAYVAGVGGAISGTASQDVAYGGSCTPVTAVPAAGYAFAGWSDGVTAATRTDTGVTVDKTVSASFSRVLTKAKVVKSPNVSKKTYKRKSGAAKFTLSAVVTGWGGLPVSGKYVYLQSSKNGKSWSNTYKIKTNASGKASKYFKVKVKRVRYYRWYVPAQSELCLKTYSSKTKITVR